jgi:hypothetical protein
MSEKRGQTEKIKFEFNTAGVLEIQYNTGTWGRVTAITFRAYDGPRRITEPQFTEKSNPHVPMRTYLYEGPVYYYGSNKEAVKQNNHTVRNLYNS